MTITTLGVNKMAIAAVPGYLQKENLSKASPALRFGMYLELWGINSKSEQRLWETHDVNYRRTGTDKQEKPSQDSNKQPSLEKVVQLNRFDLDLMNRFNKRQQAVFDRLPNDDTKHRLIAQSTAPFTTGLGNEHPLENGFAFLNPYGLSYLPGSGVKGVVRRAAEELAGIAPGICWEDESGWTAEAIDILFGPSDTENARRGALSFWDVMPVVKGNKLTVEIMTPHYSHYYQQKHHEGSISPHDSGQPTPICFLTVPPGSGFTFHVTCDRRFLSPDAGHPANRWQELLASAFEHAFAWCGFGAKTAVGYGVMERDPKEKEAERLREEQKQKEKEEREREERRCEEQERKEKEERKREEQLAKMSPAERIEQEIQEMVDTRRDKNMPPIAVVYRSVKDGHWSGLDKIEAAKWLKKRMSEGETKNWPWKEQSIGGIDKYYQRTCEIKDWLKGQ